MEIPKKLCLILRGPSGAGKSTFATERLPTTADIVSADKFFMQQGEDGLEYQFNPAKLGEAHSVCLAAFIRRLEQDAPLIVVDNTATEHWEYSNYYTLAGLFDYTCLLCTFLPASREAVLRTVARAANSKGTPSNVVLEMWRRFQPHWDAGEELMMPDASFDEFYRLQRGLPDAEQSVVMALWQQRCKEDYGPRV